MIPAQEAKWVNCLTDQSKDNAAFTAVAVDCKGFSYAEIAAIVQNVPANMAGLKIQESDDNSTYADVTGLIIGTSACIDGDTSALPTAAAGDDTLHIFQIDLRGRKRYLKVVATAGNGSGTATELTAVARLSRPAIVPDDEAEAGADQILRV